MEILSKGTMSSQLNTQGLNFTSTKVEGNILNLNFSARSWGNLGTLLSYDIMRNRGKAEEMDI